MKYSRVTHSILSCIGSLLLLILATASYATNFDHVIFFGDSLSDIGNMPESPTLIDPNFGQVSLNLYVPIANPVMPTQRKYQIPQTSLQFNYPTPSPMPQPPLHAGKQSYPRKYHSLNWTQFFLSIAQHQELVSDSHPLVPWVWWYKHKHIAESINFAFAGATSDNLCRNFEYANPNPICTARSVYQHQKHYRLSGFMPTNHNTNYESLIQVPGLLKQIALFGQAKKTQPKLATNNTLYVIMIGGNDLNLDLLNLTKKHIKVALHNVFGGGASQHVDKAIRTLIRRDHAKHIVIMNLFDMGISPYLRTNIKHLLNIGTIKDHTILLLTKLAINSYNRQLKKIVKDNQAIYSSLPNKRNVTIQYFDTYYYINQLAKSPQYNTTTTQYQMCQQPHQHASFYVQQNFCKSNRGDYLFWNGVHPSTNTSEYISYQLALQLLDQ